MTEISNEECKRLLIKILQNVTEFCEKNNIKYSLAYGTLIGAIRHKGFIPWDDDIDIIMMRDEYERFVQSYKDDYYKLILGKDLANHYHVVVSDYSTKLEFKKNTANEFFYKGGIWVDIFPIDKVPEDNGAYRKLIRKIHLMAGLEQAGQYKKNMYRAIPYYFLKPLSKLFGEIVHNLISFSNNSYSSKVANLSLFYLRYPSFPASYLTDFIEVEFEGNMYKAMKQYDSYLRGIYGEYMKLPPLKDQTPRHEYKVYWRG